MGEEALLKPDLVCKIEVQKTDGKMCIGSGYPITPNRIITAAHVIADAQPVEGQGSKGIACSSKLLFPGYTWKSEPQVYIEWDGRAAGVDGAVLRCELPDDLRPVHTLQEKKPTGQIDWRAQGYTKYGEKNQPSGKDAYRGTMAPIAASEISFTLECENYPHSSRDWEGGSGSVAFDSPEPKIALAVITDYQGGKKLDQLIAVPICYLLDLDGFRQAIQFDVYAERKNHYDKVHTVVMQQLEKMTDNSFLTVARRVAEKVGADSSLIDLDKKVKRLLAEECAFHILEQQKVTEVVGSLVGLRLSLGRDEFAKLVPIVNHVLPLNYAPHAVQRLREHVSQGRLGFVVGVVTTRTAAELIMAGYDQSSALAGKRPHKTSVDWVRQMMQQGRWWLPDRLLVLVVDGGFAAVALALACTASEVVMVSRMRLDAALYHPPAPRPAKAPGRKPTKGPRQRSLRVCPESLRRITKFSDHQANRRETNESQRTANPILKILG